MTLAKAVAFGQSFGDEIKREERREPEPRSYATEREEFQHGARGAAGRAEYASGDGAAANAFLPPAINTTTLRLRSGCKARVRATIGVSSGSRGQALLVARELTFARVTPLPTLQTVGIILGGCWRRGEGCRAKCRSCDDLAHFSNPFC